MYFMLEKNFFFFFTEILVFVYILSVILSSKKPLSYFNETLTFLCCSVLLVQFSRNSEEIFKVFIMFNHTFYLEC